MIWRIQGLGERVHSTGKTSEQENYCARVAPQASSLRNSSANTSNFTASIIPNKSICQSLIWWLLSRVLKNKSQTRPTSPTQTERNHCFFRFWRSISKVTSSQQPETPTLCSKKSRAWLMRKLVRWSRRICLRLLHQTSAQTHSLPNLQLPKWLSTFDLGHS